MDRLKAAGVLASTCGTLLIVALLLDWWDYPTAFDDPESLPPDAQFIAEGVAASGQPVDADGFEFFEFRDALWLVTGIAGFGFGVLALLRVRFSRYAALALGVLALASTALLVATLVAPPDFAELAPDEAEVDFGVELPIEPQLGGFVALVAAGGLLAAVGLAMLRGREG